MRPTYLFLVFLFTIFMFSSCSHNYAIYASSSDKIEKTFQVDFGGKLDLETDLGSIEVKAVSGKKVHVEVFKIVKGRYRDEAEEVLKDFEVRFKKIGKNVQIRGKLNHRWFRRRHGLRVKFVVTVPEKYDVELKTSGGSISVADLEGKVHSRTSGGSLHFGSIKGPVYGKTSGGGINLSDCVGDAEIYTSGGSISIGKVEGNVIAKMSGGSIKIEHAKGNVVAKTSGGSIHVEEVMGSIDASTSGGSVTASILRQPKDRCQLKTSGGSITVYLADEIAADINASTSAGRVYSDFNITVIGNISKNKIVGKINGGGPELYLRTSGGNIKIKKL